MTPEATGSSSLRSTVRSAASLFATTTAISAATLLVYMVTARFLTRTQYGDVQALISIATIGAIPAGVAGTVLARRVAALSAAGLPLRALVRRVLAVTWVGAPIVAVAGVAFCVPLARAFHVEDPRSVATAAWFLAAFSVLLVGRGLLQGEQRFDRLSFSYGLEAVLRFVCTVAATALAGEWGFFAGIGTALGAAAVKDARSLLARHAFAEDAARAEPPHTGWGPSAVALLTVTVLSFYDIVLVKRWFAPDSAGLYASAAVVGRMALAAVQFVPQMLLPRVVAASTHRRSTGRLLLAAASFSALPLMAVLLAVAFAPGFVLAVVAGPRFVAAASLTLPLTAAAAALAYVSLGTTFLIGRHRFAFVPGLVVVGAAEIVALTLHHPTLQGAAIIVLCGHTALLAVVALGVLTSRDAAGQGQTVPSVTISGGDVSLER